MDMNNLAMYESTPVGDVVYRLEGYDPEGSKVHYGLVGTDRFKVDRDSGEVTVAKPLDREVSNMKKYDNLSDFVLIRIVELHLLSNIY